MIPNRVAVGALRLAAAEPSTWLTCAVLLLAWPCLSSLASIGLGQYSPNDLELLYELAIISIGLGCLRGVAVLATVSKSVAREPRGPNLRSSALALGSLGVLHVLIALLPPMLMGHFPWEPRALEFGLRLALVLPILVAIARLLLRFEIPAGSAPWILGLAFLLASVLLPHPIPTRSLSLLATGLLWAAWLLDHPPGRTT